jgi:integrase
MSAWVKQIANQVAKYGKEKASWYCEWDEPDGSRRCKSCGPGPMGKRDAERMAKHIRAELLTNTYSRTAAMGWVEFRAQYQNNVLSGLSPLSARSVSESLNHFEQILRLKEKTLEAITADRVADFKAERRKAKGKKPGSVISPASVNKDLRHVKAALRVACEWGYIERVPKIRFEREPKTLPRYVTPEHFGVIYGACDGATLPDDLQVEPSVWWRGLVVMGQMTGWRISEILALKWQDVDLHNRTAKTRATDNKGKRDAVVGLHPVVVEHLLPLKTFHPNVFPWDHDRKLLSKHFHAIQAGAGIDLPCRVTNRIGADLKGTPGDASGGHVCTTACHRYGFHDLRRAFATMHAANMTRETLQALMRHQSSLTTERYINFARQMNPAVANLHVPEVLRLNAVS